MTLTKKLFIINFAGACLVGWAWWLGYVHRLTDADGAHMAYIIATVFLTGVASTFMLARATDKRLRQCGWLNDEKRKAHDGLVRSSAHLYDLFSALFILGIIGNAIGFLNAFSGVNVADLATPEGVRAAGAQLLSGAGTAFGSTLVGLSLALWTSVNLRVLATGQDRLNG
ncbi:hypothetical protein LB517_28285 [Mesorhizobium sp. BR1-1-12]|uniref:hypothetical protein n=1 Tax=Mesorhizobium sp. BR1-1-12 TaxID=2876657 RepID=UPI001CD187B3|nr:hypothetical protein [Mesorhizobium sp. BR1-1-12]MBZ9973533.1 hypothetical protein [Mesorhizobium sp. BR1-1-12]